MNALLIAPQDASAPGLKETTQKALEAAGVRLRIPEFEAGRDFGGDITEAIASADLVIADVSAANPNVLYELGYAHAQRKTTILIMSKDANTKLPSDLEGMYYRIYDPGNLSELGEYLTRTALGLKQRREALA